MQLIESFIRNPVKVSVAVLLVVLFGLIACLKMPVQLTPEVQRPVISIETDWPGASPQEVEQEITQEQEKQLKGVEGMTKMTSESTDSSSEITLEFAVGTDMPEALLKVNSRLQQVRESPLDAEKPYIRTSDLSRRSIAVITFRPRVASVEEIRDFQAAHPKTAEALEPAALSANTGSRLKRLIAAANTHPEVKTLLPKKVDVPTLKRFAEDVIQSRLERVKGVSAARVLGGLEEELQITVNPQHLASRHLRISDIRRALQAENADISGGDFWEGKRRNVVRTLGQFRTPEEVESVVVAHRDNSPVYLRDIAKVKLGYKKPSSIALRIGTDSITVLVSRETNANVLDVMEGIRAAIDELNNGILKRRGLALEQVYDETEYIYSSIGMVRQNIFIGGALTILVLLLFLRSGRSTLIVGLAIPTCIIGTFLVLHLLGRTLNVVSLAGLAFAVGMLVDNAVVVLENIYRHYQQGENPVRSAVNGTQEVWGAVVASTLTTLAVFLPVLFIEEEAGQLFRDIALAISSAVGLSLLVSVVMIPTAAAKILQENRRKAGTHPDNGNGNGRTTKGTGLDGTTELVHASQTGRRDSRLLGAFSRFGSNFVETVVGINSWLQGSTLRRVLTVIIFLLAAEVICLSLMPKVEYLPNGNRNLIYGSLTLPPGYNLDQMRQIGMQIQNDLKPYWDVDLDSESVKELDYPPIADFFYIAYGRQVFMGVRSADSMRAGELIPLMREVTSRIPGGIGGARQSSLFASRRGAGRSIEIDVTGPELERLVQIGGDILTRVAEVIPDAQARPVPSLELSNPEVHVIPDRVKAVEMGLSAEEVGRTVDALVDGARVGDYFIDGDRIDLRIIGEDDYASHQQDLHFLPLATASGHVVPLASVATIIASSGPEQINHRERQRAITVQVTPPDEMPLQDAMDRIRADIVAPIMERGDVAGQYQINLSGEADKLQKTWEALRWNVVLAVLITYLLMAALFESWLYPFVIMFSVPLGAAGGFIGLQCLNIYLVRTGQGVQHLDVLTMLGFVILIGTVVNNAILIVQRSLQPIRDGVPARQAVLESVRTRIRPIFMTTMTTILGLLPLVLLPGAGNEIYRGLGSVVLGGLLVSTVFTLVLVPTLFTLTMDARHFLLRRKGHPAARSQPIRERKHEPAYDPAQH